MSKEDDVFNSVFTYIEDNLTEKLTVEEIAKHVYLSPTYLQSVFKEHFGIPLAEYVRSQKLKRAMDLLYNTVDLSTNPPLSAPLRESLV